MLRKLSLAICLVGILASFGFAQNGVSNATKVLLYTTSGEGWNNVGVGAPWLSKIDPTLASGQECLWAFQQPLNPYGLNLLFQKAPFVWEQNTSAICGGLTVSFDQTRAIGAVHEAYGLWLNTILIPATPVANWATDYNQWIGRTWVGGPGSGFSSSNKDAPVGLSITLQNSGNTWSTCIDELGTGKAYDLELRYNELYGQWMGIIARYPNGLNAPGSVPEAIAYWFITQGERDNVNQWSHIKVWGDYLYMVGGSNGRNVYRIPKNFVNEDSVTLYCDASIVVPGYEWFSGSNNWQGLTFDDEGNIYIAHSELIAKFNPAGALVHPYFIIAGNVAVRDIEFGAGKMYIAVGEGTTNGGIEVWAKDPVTKLFTFEKYIATSAENEASGQVEGPDGNGAYKNSGACNNKRIRDISLVPAPATVTFTGTVNLLGWMGASLPSVNVVVDGGAPVATALTPVDADTGTFTVSLPATGSHSVKVKAAVTLSQTQSGTTPALVAATFNLQCGDNTNDNVIDDFDFNAVITNFGSGAGGDGNGDAATDDFDFNLVITNFGSTGS